MIKYKEFDKLPVKLELDDVLEKTNACITHKLSNSSQVISGMMEHLAGSQGKGIRTQLLAGAALDEDGTVPRDAVLVAAGIELLHLATLVHDDVIDDAPLRRGVTTLQSKYGKKAAVIGGDYLLCIALSTISPIFKGYLEQPYIQLGARFSNALEHICLGEYRQHVNNRNWEISVYEYLKTISGKTAALFEISAYAGAIIGGCSERDIKLISRFGKYVGMIFQISDDCKDYELTEEIALKPVKHDIAEGVVTLPLIMAFMKEPQLRKLARDSMFSSAEIYALAQQVCTIGGVEEAKLLSKRYGKKAERIIEKLDNQNKKEKLREILNKALGVTL